MAFVFLCDVHEWAHLAPVWAASTFADGSESLVLALGPGALPGLSGTPEFVVSETSPQTDYISVQTLELLYSALFFFFFLLTNLSGPPPPLKILR